MILKASTQDAIQVAKLHQQTITEGFLQKLGVGFLRTLYVFIIQKELVLVYREENKVQGFVSCALSSKGIIKRFLLSGFSGVFQLALALLKNPKLLPSALETFRAPVLSNADGDKTVDIPETELLSISVSTLAQKGGIGTALLFALEEELKSRGILKYKVIAGEKLDGANSFYKKNGFVLAKQITIHGNDVSNIYVKTIIN